MSSTAMTIFMQWHYFPLDSIPRCVYMVSICSKKEAVIAKPHLFLLKRGAAAVCPRVPEAPWQVRTAVGALSSLRILAPQLGGTSPTQLILEINGSGHQSYSSK